MFIPAAELRRNVKRDNDLMPVEPETGAAVDAAYAAVDWAGLEAAGFDKHGDYCFIYSYPPVRTLAPIDPEAMFTPSPWEPITDLVNVYVHIPYCSGICSYCYFAKVVDNGRSAVSTSIRRGYRASLMANAPVTRKNRAYHGQVLRVSRSTRNASFSHVPARFR